MVEIKIGDKLRRKAARIAAVDEEKYCIDFLHSKGYTILTPEALEILIKVNVWAKYTNYKFKGIKNDA
jgi:hypothetical protein